MNNRQRRTVEAFRRALGFVDTAPLKPEPELFAKMRNQLRAACERLSELSTEQLSADGEISNEARLIRGLRTHLRRKQLMPLMRIAKPLLGYAPGVERTLRVPHARADNATLVAGAQKMLNALKPHAKLLASAGVPKTALAELQDQIKKLGRSSSLVDNARRRRAKATLEIRREIEKGMKTLTVLEGLIMYHTDDAVVHKMWQHSRRVTARTGRPRSPRRRLQIAS